MPATTVIIGNVATIWNYDSGGPGGPGSGGTTKASYLTSTRYALYVEDSLDFSSTFSKVLQQSITLDSADFSASISSISLRDTIVMIDFEDSADFALTVDSIDLVTTIIPIASDPEELDFVASFASISLVQIVIIYVHPPEDNMDFTASLTSISLGT